MAGPGNIGAIVVALFCGALGFIGVAALAPSNFDYANASEDARERYLTNIANGFERGFNATSAGQAEIKQINVNPQADAISIDVRFVRKEIEYAPAKAVEEFRRFVYENNCAFLDKKTVLEKGVTLKIRMTKPSGAPLTNFTLNSTGCAPYLKAA